MSASTPAWASFAHRYPVDGLRAIAALVVVLFHCGMPGFANGFVGVDVFFVLSGFLITSLLLRERLTSDGVSLRGFYARRVRRLLPAALLVLGVTAVVYQFVASPLDVLENRLGFVFAALYVSNWYFLGQAQDYFAAGTSPSPVLHYWSLSVEEQFYLVWPALLAGLLAFAVVRRRLAPLVIGALAVGTLALSWVIDVNGPTGAYFNTFARAYQLLAGAALAAGVLWWRRRRDERGLDQPQRGALGATLALAGVAVVLLSSTSVVALSPWWIGLIGTVATVALLLGIELAPSSRALAPMASRPARALGRWSYSTYLWHWPVIVIAGVVGMLPIDWWWRVPGVLLVTIGLAALTYRFVEAPVNGLSVATAWRQARMLGTAVVATAVAAVLCLVVLRVPAQAEQLVAVAQQGQVEQDDGPATVLVEGDDTAPDASGSATPDPTGSPDGQLVSGQPGGSTSATSRSRKPTVMIVGDSHADFWKEGFTAYAKQKGFRVVFVVSQGCPWMDIPAISEQTGKDHECQDSLWKPALDAARTYRPDVTLLISRSVLSRELDTPSGVIGAEDPGWEDIVRSGITRSLRQITPLSRTVVLVEPLPQTRTPMLDCLTRGGPSTACSQPAIPTRGTEFVESVYADLAASNPNVVSVSLDDVMCPKGQCPAMVKGVPTMPDATHMTHEYAAMLVPQVDAALRAAGVSLTR